MLICEQTFNLCLASAEGRPDTAAVLCSVICLKAHLVFAGREPPELSSGLKKVEEVATFLLQSQSPPPPPL